VDGETSGFWLNSECATVEGIASKAFSQLDQLGAFASLLVLTGAAVGVGLAVFKCCAVKIVAVDAFYALAAGWGAIVIASVIGTYLQLPLSFSLGAAVVLGNGALLYAVLHDQGKLVCRYGLVALACVIPVIVVAASFRSVQYDEFAQWLPNAFYLYDNDTLPSRLAPNVQTAKQGYPIAVPYITYALGTLRGQWDDALPKAFPVVMAGLFAVIVAAVAQRTDRPSFTAVAIASLFTSLLNPFFDPRIAITSYSDIPTAFLMAAMVYALWRSAADASDARSWMVRASFTALTLAEVRETNIVVVAAAAAGLVLAHLVGRSERPATVVFNAMSAAARFIALPFAGILVWSAHLLLQDVPSDVRARPISSWDWHAPIAVLHSLFTERLQNNILASSAALLIVLVAAGLGAAAWRGGSVATRRLLVIVGVVATAHFLLLAFAYVAFFSPEEVRHARSAWRYASQLGPTILVTLLAILPTPPLVYAEPTEKPPGIAKIGLLAAVMCVIVGVQTLFSSRWRVDCAYPHVRPSYDALVTFFKGVPAGKSVAIINPHAPTFSVISRLARVVATRDWKARPAMVVDRLADESRYDYVVDLRSATPERAAEGATSITALVHRERLSSIPIASTTLPFSCVED